MWRLLFDDDGDATYGSDRVDGCELFSNAAWCPDVADRLAELEVALGAQEGGSGSDDLGAGDEDSGDDDDGVRVLHTGEALVSSTTFSGTEVWTVTTPEDELVCELESVLTQSAVRDDCAPPATECSWAFDLIRSTANLKTSVDDYCTRYLGVDASTVDSVNGWTASYGHGLYLGHANVLVVDEGEGWFVDGYTSWVESTGEFNWDRTIR